MSDIDYSKIIPSKIENYFSKIYISYYQNGIKKYDNFPYLGYYYTCDSKEPIVKKEDCQKILFLIEVHTPTAAGPFSSAPIHPIP